jgi:hypothetical protein
LTICLQVRSVEGQVLASISGKRAMLELEMQALFLWPQEVVLLLPLMAAENKAIRCTLTAWPLAICLQVRRVEGEVLLASISGKRAMMALLFSHLEGRRRKK